jgi:hypothetical protein
MNSVSPNWLKTIQELSPRILFGLGVLCLLILILPSPIADWFGIDSIRSHYRGWLGVITLASFAFGVVQLIPSLWWRNREYKRRKGILNSIDTLSKEELLILTKGIVNGQQTILEDATNPYAHSLCEKGLLVQVTATTRLDCWPFIIPDFVWRHFRSPYALKKIRERLP